MLKIEQLQKDLAGMAQVAAGIEARMAKSAEEFRLAMEKHTAHFKPGGAGSLDLERIFGKALSNPPVLFKWEPRIPEGLLNPPVVPVRAVTIIILREAE